MKGEGNFWTRVGSCAFRRAFSTKCVPGCPFRRSLAAALNCESTGGNSSGCPLLIRKRRPPSRSTTRRDSTTIFLPASTGTFSPLSWRRRGFLSRKRSNGWRGLPASRFPRSQRKRRRMRSAGKRFTTFSSLPRNSLKRTSPQMLARERATIWRVVT